MNFFSFVFIVAGFIPQIAISQNGTYYIGDAITVKWDNTLLPNANDVDIVLYWGTNSTWTLATVQCQQLYCMIEVFEYDNFFFVCVCLFWE